MGLGGKLAEFEERSETFEIFLLKGDFEIRPIFTFTPKNAAENDSFPLLLNLDVDAQQHADDRKKAEHLAPRGGKERGRRIAGGWSWGWESPSNVAVVVSDYFLWSAM